MGRPREELLRAWRRKIESGQLILGTGVVGAAADFCVVTNSLRFRPEAPGSLFGMLPFGDANAIVLGLARESLARSPRTPLIAGVCGTDPMRLMDKFLPEVAEAGFAGVQNFPTLGLIDGVFRASLEETHLGYGREVEMVRMARGIDLLTLPFVFTAEDAAAMAAAGADAVVVHLGLATAGPAGGRARRTPAEAAVELDRVGGAARETRKEVLVLAHGGPILGVQEAAKVASASRLLEGIFLAADPAPYAGIPLRS